MRTLRLVPVAGLLFSTLSCFGGDSSAPEPTATKVGFTVSPGTVAAGTAIAPSLTVALQDATGATMSVSDVSVTVAITAGTGVSGATLGGTLTRSTVSGVATFDNLTIDKAGSGYTLTATSSGLTLATTATFTVTAGAATKLVMGTQPSSAASAAAISPAVTVTVQDALGNTATTSTASVTVAITSGTGASGATLNGTKTAAAANGVATFSGLSIDKAGTGYTLSATATNLTSATSTAFAITAGAASQLVVSAQPSAVVSAAAVSPAVAVTVQDAAGNTVTSSTASITVAITGSTGTAGAALGGTKTVAAVSGVASFSTLTVDKSGTGYTLTATATGLTSAATTAFNVTAGAASQLAFSVQPSNAVSAAAIAAPVQVLVQDAQGNTVTTATTSITVAIGTNPASGVLGGTLTVAAVNGIATLSNLTVDKAGTGYTLTAAATSLTGATSSAFNITAGVAAKLAFSVQPSNTVSAVAIAAAVQVVVQDAQGNTVTSATNSITVAVGTNPASGVLGGTLTIAAVSGVATLSNLTIDKAGTGYTLTAAATSLTGATSSTFNITAAGAAKLAFSVQPSNSTGGSAIGPAVQVAVQDAQGNTVTSATHSITIAIGTNPASGTLSGTMTVAAVSGVASFSTLAINKVGTGYTLGATATSLTAATSGTFNVAVGAASQMAFNVQPTDVVSLVAIGPAVQVTVLDAGGNTVTTATNSITINTGFNPASATMGGTLTVAAVNGIATFSNLTVDKASTAMKLQAEASGLTTSLSGAFNVTHAAAAKLEVQFGPPSQTASMVALTPAVKIAVKDASGNTVLNSSASVTLALNNGPGGATLGGTLTVAAVNGVATFSNLTGDKVGFTWRIAASSGGLTGINTDLFEIVAGAAANIAVNAGNAQSSIAGNALSTLPSVLVTDAGGNPISGVNVTFLVTGGGGNATGLSKSTNSSGIAEINTWTLGNTAGANTMTATAAGLTGSPVTFTETGIAGPATQFVQTGGSFTGRALTAVSAPPTVKVVDNHGNGVSGVSVSFVPATSGAIVTGGTQVSDAGGLATPVSWTLGTNTSVNEMTVSGGGLPQLTIAVNMLSQIFSGGDHSCALATTGEAYCWGAGIEGQLGHGGTGDESKPTATKGGLIFETLTLNGYSTCGKKYAGSGGTAHCWGAGGNGQLGTGATSNVLEPTGVSGGFTWDRLATGNNGLFMCGITSGTARCWGQNTQGQLGNGGTTQATVPNAVGAGSEQFGLISVGENHTCALGTVVNVNAAYCWGSNEAGKLGNGGGADQSAPVQVSGGLPFSKISTGGAQTCGITTGNVTYCWGANYFGEVGNNSGTPASTPVAVNGSHTFTSIVAASGHTCAINNAGAAYCWGRGTSGQLGNAGTSNSAVPVAVSGGITFSAIGGGQYHMCGLSAGGAVYCWGKNDKGQLGDGTTTDRNVPTLVVHK